MGELSHQSTHDRRTAVKVPSVASLTEAASMLTAAANEPGVSAITQAAYLDAATTLMDVALIAPSHGETTGAVSCAW